MNQRHPGYLLSSLGMFLAASMFNACSSDSGNNSGATGGTGKAGATGVAGSATGGRTGSGGSALNTGGTKASGGSSGNLGGSIATGGAAPTGGAVASGGAIATGGAVPTGGAVASGGAIATGGVAPTGGNTSTGGATATGGAAPTGGAIATGGATATGGDTSTGGAIATGGDTSTGGATATGGDTSTGGATATGGDTSTGGATATGGDTSTGGATTTGGNTSTGGATATGGSSATCDALDAYWRLDEASGSIAHDSVGSHLGTLQNAPTWTTGKLGGALHFNGSNYVSIPDAADLDPGTGDFSLEAWVMIPAGQKGQQRIVAHGSNGGGGYDGFSFMEWCAWGAVPCGGVGILVGKNGGGEWFAGTCSAMDDGQWHHYVATVVRTSNISFFVDGLALTAPCTGTSGAAAWGSQSPTDITPLAGADLDCPCPLCLGTSCEVNGSCTSGTSEPFTGDLDELGFYKRAITPQEVSSHYANGSGSHLCSVPTCRDDILDGDETDVDCGGSCSQLCAGGQSCGDDSDCASGDCQSNVCLSTPIARYPLDETSGTAVQDTVAAHDGTLTGGVWETGSACKHGGCLRLDGSSYAQVLSPTWLPVGAAARTVALWVNPGKDLYSSTESCMVQYGTPANAEMFGLVTSMNAPNHLYFYGHNADLSSSHALVQNTWQHVAVTYDGVTVKLYYNGLLDGQAAMGLNTVLDTNGLTLGLRPGGALWTGLLDELEIYDRALTDAEIAVIAQ